MYDSRVESAKRLRNAIQRTPIKQSPSVFVQVTGVGFYEPHETKVYDESSDGGKHDFLAKLVVDWEEAAKLPPESKVRNVNIRAGAVLGRNGGLVAQVITPFFFGVGGVMGSGQQWMPWIHVKDLTGLILHSIENEKVEGVLNGVAPEAVSNRQFVEAFAGALNRPAFIPVPEFVWNTIFGPERAAIVVKGQHVLPKRSLESGYKFRFPTISSACQEFSFLRYVDLDDRQS